MHLELESELPGLSQPVTRRPHGIGKDSDSQRAIAPEVNQVERPHGRYFRAI